MPGRTLDSWTPHTYLLNSWAAKLPGPHLVHTRVLLTCDFPRGVLLLALTAVNIRLFLPGGKRLDTMGGPAGCTTGGSRPFSSMPWVSWGCLGTQGFQDHPLTFWGGVWWGILSTAQRHPFWILSLGGSECLAVPALSFQAWAKKGLLVSPQHCLGRNSVPAALSVTQITVLSTPAFPAWS